MCPKDAYALPNIDRLVDRAVDHQVLSFLDIYSRYNQIRMDPRDKENMMFNIKSTNYCYRVMPFEVEECQSNISALNGQNFLGETWPKPGSLCGRHGGQVRQCDNSFGRSRKNLRSAQKVQHKAKP